MDAKMMTAMTCGFHWSVEFLFLQTYANFLLVSPEGQLTCLQSADHNRNRVK